MRCRAGHTLLELMVVISIIFTMLAIFMPYYVKAVKMARHRADMVCRRLSHSAANGQRLLPTRLARDT